jgi:hypothetical protein
MTGFHVDGRFPDHRKVRKLGNDRLAAVGLWTLCGAWCREHDSDGFVPVEVLGRWDSGAKIAARLVRVGLWFEDSLEGEPGYRYHEWNEWRQRQDAEEEDALEKRRAAERERSRRYRERRNLEVESPFSVDDDSDVTVGDTALQGVDGIYLHTIDDTALLSTGESGNGETAGQSALEEDGGLFAQEGLDTSATLKHLSLSSCSFSVTKSVKDSRPSFNPKASVETGIDEPTEEDHFTEFWNAYPKKHQRQDARKAWLQQRRKGIKPEQLISGAKGYAQRCQQRGTDKDYIKLPASWMRAGAYEDYQPEPEAKPDTREPVEILRDYWRDADARTVAALLRVPFYDKGQPPSDKTPHATWIRKTRQAWIEEHFADAVKVLEETRAQGKLEPSETALGPAIAEDPVSSVSVQLSAKQTPLGMT